MTRYCQVMQMPNKINHTAGDLTHESVCVCEKLNLSGEGQSPHLSLPFTHIAPIMDPPLIAIRSNESASTSVPLRGQGRQRAVASLL